MDWEIFVAMATSLILSTVKNAAKKAKIERAMYKVYTTLQTSYPQFQDSNYKPPAS